MKYSFGKRLKQARFAAGLTQLELGEKCGYNGDWIAQYEAGTRKPGLDNIILIIKALKINAGYLLGTD